MTWPTDELSTGYFEMPKRPTWCIWRKQGSALILNPGRLRRRPGAARTPSRGMMTRERAC